MSTTAIGTPDSSKNISNVSSFSLSPTALTSVISTPRVGTEFKDRIFVGGFPPSTSDTELRAFFSRFGEVKEAKIIRDHSGASKGYGFITYATEEEATGVRQQCGGFLNADSNNGEELLDFKGRKLNIGPAIRKASNLRNQNLDVIPQGAVVLAPNGAPFVVQNGYAFCATPETYAVTHPQVAGGYPFMFPQQVVVAAPHQFVIPSHMGPPASNPVQQMPTQMATPQMPQHHSSQHRVMLSPINQQTVMSQQMVQYKPNESPSKQMNMQMQTPPPPMNCTNNYGRYNYKYVRTRSNPVMTTGYMRNGYNCPECLDVQNANDGVYPPGVFTPPPTPITM